MQVRDNACASVVPEAPVSHAAVATVAAPLISRCTRAARQSCVLAACSSALAKCACAHTCMAADMRNVGTSHWAEL